MKKQVSAMALTGFALVHPHPGSREQSERNPVYFKKSSLSKAVREMKKVGPGVGLDWLFLSNAPTLDHASANERNPVYFKKSLLEISNGMKKQVSAKALAGFALVHPHPGSREQSECNPASIPFGFFSLI